MKPTMRRGRGLLGVAGLLSALLAPLRLAGQPTSAPTSAPAARPEQQVDLIYTGNTGGLADASASDVAALLLLRYITARRGSLTIDRSGKALRLGPHLLFDPDGFAANRAIRLLRQPRLTAKVLEESLPYLEDEHSVIFQYPPNPNLDLLVAFEQQNRQDRFDSAVARHKGRLIEYRSSGGERLLVLDRGADRGLVLPRDPLVWELKWIARAAARLGQEQAVFYMIPKGRGEGARRFQYLRDLEGSLPRGQSLLVSAGNEVDTFDPRTGTASAQREQDFLALAALHYAALVPGADELYFGPEELERQAKQHALSLVATNLTRRTKAGSASGEPLFSRYLIRRVGALRIGIIGLVSPDIAEHVRDPATLAGVSILDPAAAASAALAEMRSLTGSKPDLVVALGKLSEGARAEFIKRCTGVDIFIGEFINWSLHPPEEQLQIRSRRLEAETFRSPLLEVRTNSHRVGHIRVDFAGGELEHLTHHQQTITAELPRSEEVHRRTMALTLRDLRASEAVLLPPLEQILEGDAQLVKRVLSDPEFTRVVRDAPEGPPLWFTPKLWSNLFANLLRQAAHADVALVQEARDLSTKAPGPVREEYVLDWAQDFAWGSSEDPVALYELTGAQLRQAAQACPPGVIITGLDLETLQVGGRELVDKERYRVVLGQAVARMGALERLLRDVAPAQRFALRQGHLSEAQRGQIVRLREVVMAVLRQMRKQDPTFGKAYRSTLRSWLQPQGKELVPRWSFAAEGLTLSFASYGSYPSGSWTRFAGVREMRAVMPSNYTIGAKGTLAAIYDSAALTWDTRTSFSLSETVMNLEAADKGTVVQKAADDLVASTELRLKLIELGLSAKGRAKLIPYANVTFDTEFTPTTNQLTGAEYPHQQDLLGSVGLVTFPGALLEELRLAGIVRSDFAAETGKVDGGLLVGFKLGFPLWLARLKIGGTLRYFAPRAADPADKLGLIVQGNVDLVVPFTRDLSVSLGADLFLFRPKVLEATDLNGEPTKRGTAASLILSAGISFDHLWKL